MKKLLLLLIFLFGLNSSLASCSANDSKESEGERPCGFHNGKQLYTGPKGGCYYYNENSNKTYVDRKECNC